MNKIVATMTLILSIGTLQAVEVTNKSNQTIKIRIEGTNIRMGYSQKFDIQSGGTIKWDTTPDICITTVVIEHDGKINLRKELKTKSCHPSKITLENPSGDKNAWTLKQE